MRITRSVAALTAFATLIAPALTFAQGPEHRTERSAVAHTSVEARKNENEKKDLKVKQDMQVSFSGKVTAKDGMTVTLLTTSNVTYTVDLTNAKIVRRFGAKIAVNDIQVNDQLAVQGKLTGNAIAARNVQDLSLQARNGEFKGTIKSVSPDSFVLQSEKRGAQVIYVNASTTIKLNGQVVAFSGLTAGLKVEVNGVWNSANSSVVASKIVLNMKEERLQLYGTVSSASTTSIGLNASNGKTYTIDVTKAELVARNYVGPDFSKVKVGDSIQIVGKGMAVATTVKASLVVDFSL